MVNDVEVINFGGGELINKAAKTAPEQSPDTLPTAERLRQTRGQEKA